MSVKRPSDENLRKKMNDYAGLLLDAHYGHLRPPAPDPDSAAEPATLPEGTLPATLPKPDVFNAIVNWIRTDAGMEPIAKEKSGIADLIEQRESGRKR